MTQLELAKREVTELRAEELRRLRLEATMLKAQICLAKLSRRLNSVPRCGRPIADALLVPADFSNAQLEAEYQKQGRSLSKTARALRLNESALESRMREYGLF